tara:strand:+ start:12069 stop:12200 length:132 start_codon:yes stop_codon:yes gene_type:complete
MTKNKGVEKMYQTNKTTVKQAPKPLSFFHWLDHWLNVKNGLGS